jgi:hypothetical protein
MITMPAWLNKEVSSLCVMDFGRLPTYNLTFNFCHTLFFEGKSRHPIKGIAATTLGSSN